AKASTPSAMSNWRAARSNTRALPHSPAKALSSKRRTAVCASRARAFRSSMQWWRISRRKPALISERLVAKRFGRRRYHLSALRRHAQHGKTALVRALGPEAEHAVDAGKARGIGQCIVVQTLRPLRLHQRGNERDRIVGHRRGARRFAPETFLIAAR